MEKTTAARMRIWAAYERYMGLNLGLFWQNGVYLSSDFRAGESGGFLGVVWLGKGRFGGGFLRQGNGIPGTIFFSARHSATGSI